MSPRAGAGSIIAVLLVGVLWGLNWPTVKYLLTEIPPITIRACAFPLAAILLAIVARGLGHSLRIARGERLAVMVTGCFVIFGFNVLTVFGQMMVQTSRAAIIAYTMPALTALLATLFLGERLGVRLWLALAIGMTGLAVLASEDFAGLAAAPAGPMLMAGAALSWAIGNVLLKARRWRTMPIALTVWFFVVSSALSWPLVLAFEAPWERSWPSVPVLWTFAYHVLGPMVVCYVLWTILIARLPVTVAAISTLTAPVVGVGSAVLLLGDPLTWQKVVSLLLVVVSIAMTLGGGSRRAAAATDAR